MADAAPASTEPGETECPVCHEDFTEPKILPCGHLLCLQCLVKWLQSSVECPLCRSAIAFASATGPKQLAGHLNNSPRACSEIANQLPTDLSMVALVGSTKLFGKDHFCCVCDDVAATSVCFDCHDMLCQSCVKVHGKLSGTRMHTVETLASLTPQRLAASRPALCPSHEDERARLFCPTHETSICLLCATSDHRACHEVTKLETKLEEAAKVLNELVSVISAGETRLEVAMVELDQHAAQIEKNTEKAAQDIDAACDRLQKSVEACRRRLKELAQSAKTDAIFAVNVAKGILQKRRGNLTSHKQLVGRVQQTTPSSCLIEMATRLRDRVNGIDCSVYLPSSARTITNPMLVIEEMPLMQVERMLAHLGELKVTAAAVSAQPIDPDMSDPLHKTMREDTRHTVVKDKRRSGKEHFKY